MEAGDLEFRGAMPRIRHQNVEMKGCFGRSFGLHTGGGQSKTGGVEGHLSSRVGGSPSRPQTVKHHQYQEPGSVSLAGVGIGAMVHSSPGAGQGT